MPECGDPSRFMLLGAVADTTIKSGAEATWDHGANTQLVVDLDPEAITYLRFDLSAVTKPIAHAVNSRRNDAPRNRSVS